MQVSSVLNSYGSVQTHGVDKRGGNTAAATQTPPATPTQPAESTRVQLSAEGRAKSATAQSEAAARSLQQNNDRETAAAAAAATRQQERSNGQPAEGFSFNGVGAYSRVFGS